MSLKILIETIPHAEQRYPTVGDYTAEHDEAGRPMLRIRVSDLADWRQELLVAVHETVEAAILRHQGITHEQVDAFDMAFENGREARLKDAKTDAERDLLLIAEPGDDPLCPYRHAHSTATGVERILAAALEVDWQPYEEKIEHL